MRRRLSWALCALLLAACDDGSPATDAAIAYDAGLDGGASDAGTPDDAGIDDAGATDGGATDGGATDGGSDAGATDAGPSDAGTDAGTTTTDAGPIVRSVLFAEFCPSTPTAPGYYRGTLASNTNDIASACGLSAPGRDGAVRVEVAPGETLRAVYRHGGDGVLYLLDSCPVTSSCLDDSDTSLSGDEQVEWTNTGVDTNPVYVILDSDSLTGPQTFELDLFVTP